MGFVESTFLAALAGLAIPLLVHLIHRRRARQVDLGSIQFLRAVLEKHTRRRKVRRWTLLTLRMACIGLLALAFARPFLIARASGGDGTRVTVVLVDGSASMALADEEGVRLIDRAVEEVDALLGRLDSTERVRIALFDDGLQPLDDLDALRAAAEDRPFGATNYARALEWARDVVIESGRSRRVVHVFTDLQRSGLDFAASGALPDDAEVHVHDLGRGHVNNVAVTAARPLEPIVRPGETVRVTATVLNAGPFALEDVPVSLLLERGGRQRRERRRVSVPPSGTVDVEFDVPDVDEGLWRGRVTLDVANDVDFDDRRHVAVLSRPRWRVRLVDGAPGSRPVLSETYFLETALRLAPLGDVYAGSPFATRVVPSDDDESLSALNRAEVVVLANVDHVDDGQAAALARFVESGGALLVFTGENVRAAGYGALEGTGLAVGRIEGVERAAELPQRIASWQTGHPLFAPFDDPQHGDLRRLAFRAHTRIEPAEEAAVLATFADGTPAVLERRHGRGRVLWWTTACDADWSDWTGRRLYLPLMHQTLRYLVGLAEGGPLRQAVLGRDASADAVPRTPGTHDTDDGWLVVNTSPRESETERCTAAEFVERFGGHAPGERKQPERARTEAARPASLQLRDDEIWHWVVVALVGVLCLESFVANRTAV